MLNCSVCVCTCEDYLDFMMAIWEKMKLFEKSLLLEYTMETNYLVYQRTPLKITNEFDIGEFQDKFLKNLTKININS